MYVCLCKGITDHQIRDLVHAGARSWREVRQQTGCATQCGKCACFAKEVTKTAVSEERDMQAANLAYAV